MQKKRIVIAIPVLLVGGTEIQTLSLVRVLAGAGHAVTVCCYYEHDPAMAARFEKEGASVLLLRRQRRDGLLKLLFALVKVFKGLRPDIVHVQYLAPGFIPIIAARVARVRTVFATVHIAGSYAYGLKARLMLRCAALLCELFICVSQGAERFWFGSCMVPAPEGPPRGRRHITIYNCVDAGAIASAVAAADPALLRRDLGLDQAPVIGIVGRLAEQKGHIYLLKAMREVQRVLPRTKLLVVGDGPDREDLVLRARRLGLEESVVWLGELQPEDAWRYFGVMDVVAVPSVYEGFGLVAAEAMAAGRPVVASNIEGLSEVVSRGTSGLLVPAEDAGRLAEALVTILMDRGRAADMGSKGREIVLKRFSCERFARHVLALYDRKGEV